jgi:hypothetical protein
MIIKYTRIALIPPPTFHLNTNLLRNLRDLMINRMTYLKTKLFWFLRLKPSPLLTRLRERLDSTSTCPSFSSEFLFFGSELLLGLPSKSRIPAT